MTHFEFVTVAISIILALGIGRLLDGIRPALREGERYWVHAGWIVQKFFNHVLWWWSLWTASQVTWNLGTFLFYLAGPVVLYLQASALVSRSPIDPASWRARFFEIRVGFFLGNLALCGILLVGGVRPAEPSEFPVVPLLLLALLAVVGIATREPRAHAVIVAVALAVQLLGIGWAVFDLPVGTIG